MFHLECNICFLLFDRNEHLPRIVSCGHTFCSECLSDLLQSSKCCPSCKKVITGDSGISCDSFIVNYFVLEVKESEGQMFCSRDDFVETSFKKLLKLKMDYSKLKTAIKMRREKFDLNLTMINDVEKSINEMLEIHNPFDQNYLMEVKKFKANYDNIRRESIPSEALRLGDASMLSGGYDSYSHYLAEIYKGILSEKRFVAIIKINEETNYAKLTVRDNFLFIHSFERTKMEGDTVTVCFHDLVDKLLKKKILIGLARTSDATKDSNISSDIYGFLDLTYGSDGLYRRVFVDILSTASHLGSQFLKFCSGEEGYSYKGFTYEQKLEDDYPELKNCDITVDRLIQLNNRDKNDDTNNGFSVSRYLQQKNDSLVTCDFDTYYLRFEDDGSFEILNFRVTKKSSDNIEALQMHQNKEAMFGSQSLFSNLSIPKFDFKPNDNLKLNCTTLDAQKSNLLATSGLKCSATNSASFPTFGFQSSTTISDSEHTLRLQSSSTKVDSGTTFGLQSASTITKPDPESAISVQKSSTTPDSELTFDALNLSAKSDSEPFADLSNSFAKTHHRYNPPLRYKKQDKNLNSGPRPVFLNQNPNNTDSSSTNVLKSSCLKPDSETTYDLQSSNVKSTSPHPFAFHSCSKGPPKISKIVGSILDHEMNILETFSEAKVRNILDCGIAFKL